jgi:hypothetical protein
VRPDFPSKPCIFIENRECECVSVCVSVRGVRESLFAG